MKKRKQTSWQGVSKWYGSIVGKEGHFFHQNVVMPRSLQLLEIKSGDNVLDVACGQGVLARKLAKNVGYTGIDVSKSLIEEARSLDKDKSHKYIVADVTKKLAMKEKFNKAAIILALQNIEDPQTVFKNVGEVVQTGGRLLIVLNHPSFRIPRQSSWEEDKEKKMQYRRVNLYMSPLSIPINTHPGQKNSPVTWSFHHPLEDYSEYLYENGFLIERIQEWVSSKKSEGKAAKSENRAREEFPMFMAILAVKK